VVLQPFKVGDFITAAGVTGTVEEIGLFATTLHTPDSVKTIVGNGKIFGDTIQNFSANPYRRVELTAQLAHGVDQQAAIALLKPVLAQVPNVMAEPAPDVEILTFNLSGAVLAVRPYCHNAHYWQVYFDTNRLIRDTFAQAGFPVPELHYTVRRPEDHRLAKTA
jgi:small conductance mechanosensitive channel